MFKQSNILAILFALAVALPAGAADEASTQEKETPAPQKVEVEKKAPSQSKLGFAAAAKVGGTFHTIFNELKPFVIIEIEAGLLLLGRRLQLDLTAGWAQPPAAHSDSDERLAVGDYDWEIDQDFLSFGLNVRGRFLKTDSLFNVYGALGPRVFLLRTVVAGKSDGESFGENRQYETRFGGNVALGGELNVGPGAVLLEVSVTFGNLDGFITGDTSSSTLDAYLGYRFMF